MSGKAKKKKKEEVQYGNRKIEVFTVKEYPHS